MIPVCPALSVVVPLYNSAETLPRLLDELSALPIAAALEIVLVNDGSHDATEAIALQLIENCSVPVTFISLSRNFGEHNAVLEGLRASTGEYVVTMDDDLQNPPAEVAKLVEIARVEQRDVVYSSYEEKKHSWWRNLGSWLTNVFADWSVDKPKGLYLSSFRCLSRFVVEEIAKSSNPTPYIDALIFQVTQNVGVVKVRHDSRRSGKSGYTPRKLLRLWISMLTNASVMPLRVATLLGVAMSFVGFVAFVGVLITHFVEQQPLGWGSLMAAELLFSGTQLLLLGVVGEYIGRNYLYVSEKPQSVVRLRRQHAPANLDLTKRGF
ncbi:MAG: glycosyltransferase family 2 protein [Verrucomicrobiota bacterium]|nr:glycosyltransferase family 2 protein [Verrucomicrobiota bacterium]MDQ6940036.1 glycosyltransferase family 2 protein [Verrucomicrobiota bacterium]